MTTLAPKLFDRRFEDLLESGRSLLPGLAPAWTDHNLHDPGITLMEMIAWVSEAQMYALSRMRRDERSAYAAMFGLAARGPLPASGVIWPEPGAHALTRSLVLPAGALVHPELSGWPAFRTVHRQLWLAAKVRALRSVGASGRVRDLTAGNERGNVVFLPFGEQAGNRDILALDIVCTPGGGLFPPKRSDADGARLIIGIRADATNGDLDALPSGSTLEVTLCEAGTRYPLRVVEDTSAGFMRSGVLVLDVSATIGSPQTFSLEIRNRRGFARPPRIVRLGLNPVLVHQGALIERELHIASSLPDQELRLQHEGLAFDGATNPVKVEVEEDGALRTWTRRDRLDDSLPQDEVYMLDALLGKVTFGNGINGRMPPNGAQILLSYSTSDGAEGNAARNQRWVVAGIDGTYGSNPEPMSGGRNGFDRSDQRREARRRAREEHALVTGADLEAAALALPALEVGRAWTLASAPAAAAHGVVSLVVMRARPGGVEPDEAPETPRWLAAIERQLSARLPLGQRLQVRAPTYVPFRVDLQIEAMPGHAEAVVEAGVRDVLKHRLTLVSNRAGGMHRALGLGVTQRDLAAWVRTAEGVRRILSLRLLDGQGKAIESVAVSRFGLPRIALNESAVRVQRPTTGRMP